MLLFKAKVLKVIYRRLKSIALNTSINTLFIPLGFAIKNNTPTLIINIIRIRHNKQTVRFNRFIKNKPLFIF
jgi:hypothetical protein